jgi:imidazolonepropionase-like amidohydrolase
MVFSVSTSTTLLHISYSFDGHKFNDSPLTIEIDSDGVIASLDYGKKKPHGSLEFPEATVLPGLVDSHVHLSWDPHAKPADLPSKPIEELRARVVQNCQIGLSSGITTMRDLGDLRQVVNSVRDVSNARLPRLLTSGSPLTSQGGHCWFFGTEVDGRMSLERIITERAAQGVDIIKIMVSGGFLTPGSSPHISQFSIEDMRNVVLCAAQNGLPVAAHAHSSQDIHNAVEAGVNVVEHCSFIDQPPERRIREILLKMSDKGITLGFTVPNFDLPGPRSRVSHYTSLLRIAHEVGVRIIYSSDCGTDAAKDFRRFPRDLHTLEILGINRTEVMIGATSRAAQACGLRDIGELREGHIADLLIVQGCLAEDLSVLSHVLAVFRSGVKVSPTTSRATGLGRL